MRVLHVIPAIAPRYGGPSRAIVEMCRALAARGVDVQIATTDGDGPGRLDVPTETVVERGGVPAIFFARHWSRLFDLSRPLARWLDANVARFDAVHVHAVFGHACLAAARACQRRSVPYLVRPLGTLDPWSMAQKPLRKQLFLRLGGWRMLREAAAIHYTSADERRLAEESLGLERGFVVPLAVDDAAFVARGRTALLRERHPALGDDPYLLFLSRIHPKKGLDFLIPAFAEVARRPAGGGWRLLLAGDGESEHVAEVRRLAQSSGVDERIHFTGWLDGELKAAAIEGAGLLVLPSRQENFGLAVVEALAAGVPVLVSEHVNIAPEIAEAGAGWVTPLEPDALTRSLAEAIGCAEERTRRGEAGRDLARRRYTWDAVAQELIQVYQTVWR